VYDFIAISSRHYLSSEHLMTVRRNANRCRQLETELKGKKNIDSEHRSCAITAVLSSVAFLEAFVNETYDDAADTRHLDPRVAGLSEHTRAIMREFWIASDRGERYLSVLAKYQMALVLAGLPRLDEGANPYQDAKMLIELRNLLVHFRPNWHDYDETDKLEQKMKSRFAGSTLQPPGSRPWFPVVALGAGCAEWAYDTSKALADAWSSQMNLRPNYEADLASYETES
jgi:hypothetical protein